MLRLLYPAYTWGLFEGKNFPTGQMNAILVCISWFGFSLFCEVQSPFMNYWGVFFIPLCSLILAEGSLPLTTSLISFVSWFLVFPTKSCIFFYRHWKMCGFHKWNQLFWPSWLLQNYLQPEKERGHRGLIQTVLYQPRFTYLVSKTEPAHVFHTSELTRKQRQQISPWILNGLHWWLEVKKVLHSYSCAMRVLLIGGSSAK